MIYGLGAAAGFSPQQVGRMSHWQFLAAIEGYGQANGWKLKEDAGETMSVTRLRELGVEGF